MLRLKMEVGWLQIFQRPHAKRDQIYMALIWKVKKAVRYIHSCAIHIYQKSKFQGKRKSFQVSWFFPPKEWLPPNKAVSSPSWDMVRKEQ